LEHAHQLERKQPAKKEGKTTCKRRIHVARRQESLTMLGLWFLIRIVMAISLKNNINKNLGGLGRELFSSILLRIRETVDCNKEVEESSKVDLEG
jgi:hypothetical protein